MDAEGIVMSIVFDTENSVMAFLLYQLSAMVIITRTS